MEYEPVPLPPPEQDTPQRLHGTQSEWLPYGLRRWYLLSLMALVGGLEAALIACHSISEKNFGLDDDSSQGHAVRVTVARLIPTILAVTLVFCLSITFNDFKRTEPFARLASKTGATGDQSLTWLPGPWWKVIYAGFPRRVNDRVTNWPMICTALVYILGVLVVSPFSSTLVVSQNVFITREQPFFTLDLDPQMPIWTDPQPTTYFRTLSQAIYNVKTSAWITDKYAITPFWPAGLESSLGAIINQPEQTWKANTTVFSTNLSCEPLIQKTSSDPNAANYILGSDSGCTVAVPDKSFLGSYNTPGFKAGGVTWVSSSEITLPAVRVAATISHGLDEIPTGKSVNVSGCTGDEVMIFKTQSRGESQEQPRSGFHCSAHFFTGETLATVSIGQDSTHVDIDEEQYNLTRTRMSAATFNTPAFQEAFLNANWSTYVSVPSLDNERDEMFAYGPGNIVAAIHDFNATVLATASSSSLTNTMSEIRANFFGETIRDSFDSAVNLQVRKSQGRQIETRRRVLISSRVAFVLEAILGLQLILLAYIMVATRSCRRPLGIFADPAPPFNLAKLITDDTNNLRVLGKTANSRHDIHRVLSHDWFKLKGGQMYQNIQHPDMDIEEDTVPVDKNKGLTSNSKRMFPIKSEPQSAFRFTIILSFVILLVAILTTISVLYSYATTSGLYQKAFIYTMDVSVSGVAMQMNPATILTTLIALCIGLWWGLLDGTHRKIQPFLAMARRAIPMKKGPTISYESSYLLWATYRAVTRKHWILALVSTGAFLSQVLTLSMASLWTQETGSVSITKTVPWPLELRSVPQLYPVTLPFTSHAGNAQQDILSSLLGIGKTSWVYGATAQVALSGSDPAWASDGWAFVPIDASALTEAMGNEEGRDGSSPHAFSNMTMKTQGLRARLECSPYQNLEEDTEDAWLTKWDLGNSSQWVFNSSSAAKPLLTGYQLGSQEDSQDEAVPVLHLDPMTYTDFFASNKMLSCCENVTDGRVNSASVGYWSWNNLDDNSYPRYGGEWPANFTIKWIRGQPVEGYSRVWTMDYNHTTRCLLWTERPTMTVLNCRPVVESSDANITVDSQGRVLEYTILEDPAPDPHAWSDIFPFYRHADSPTFSANTTASYGALFFFTVLGVGDPYMMTYNDYYATPKDDGDLMHRFSIKQPGLNADYMSYAMLGSVGNDHNALLDPETLSRAAGKVFTTLFQHFATTNISSETGGNVFQPHDERLPDDIGKYNEWESERAGGQAPTREDDDDQETSSKPGNRVKNVTLSRPAEKLSINPTAAWLSMVILAYLIAICIVLAVASRQYSKLLLRRIETIADVAILMAGSPRLLDLARRRTAKEGQKKTMNEGDDDDDDYTKAKARLGWFYDEHGEERWGMEMVIDDKRGRMKREDYDDEDTEWGSEEQQQQQPMQQRQCDEGSTGCSTEGDSLILSNAWRPVRE